MSSNGLKFISCESDLESSQIVLFGAPYDGTTSFRPGARFAPSAIRLESDGIETYSPYLDTDLTDRNIYDDGDIEVPFGNRERTLALIAEKVDDILKRGKLPFMIGGEHLVTLPAVKSVFKKYEELVILHFDAHTDLRDDYLGEKHSHATVMRRIWEEVGDGRIFQFGIRSGDRSEFKWGEGRIKTCKFDCSELKAVVDQIQGKPVYITIDLDILDPSVFPGTGTPEPGGITYKELLESIHDLKTLDIVGADIVELSPHYDQSGISTAAACKIIRELLLVISD
ncbi:MAG: agmatinase [Eubacteriaceae bacterium]|nr:agmatinase [Eubacteriaceae bacterium]